MIEVRAIGCLMDDLLSLCNEDNAQTAKLILLAQQCMSTEIEKRPSFSTLSTQL